MIFAISLRNLGAASTSQCRKFGTKRSGKQKEMRGLVKNLRRVNLMKKKTKLKRKEIWGNSMGTSLKETRRKKKKRA